MQQLYRIRITNGTASYLYKQGQTYENQMLANMEAAGLFSAMRLKQCYTFEAKLEEVEKCYTYDEFTLTPIPAPANMPPLGDTPRFQVEGNIEEYYERDSMWPFNRMKYSVYDKVEQRYLSKEEITALKETT